MDSTLPATGLSPNLKGKNPQSEIYTHWLEEVHKETKKQLEKTRERINRYFDKKRQQDPGFREGDLVMLNAKDLTTKRPSKKLDDKAYGPFRINKLVGSQAARLDLPSSIKIHPVFHFALLEPYRSSDIEGRPIPRPLPVEIDNHEEWIVEDIVGSEWRINNGKKQVFYLTK